MLQVLRADAQDRYVGEAGRVVSVCFDTSSTRENCRLRASSRSGGRERREEKRVKFREG